MSSNGQAERNLWIAVLERAIQDRFGTDYLTNSRTKFEADQFLFGDDGAFRRVCDLAGMDADYLRRGLLSRVSARAAVGGEPVSLVARTLGVDALAAAVAGHKGRALRLGYLVPALAGEL